MMSSRAALSRTVRVSAWLFTRPSSPWPPSGAKEDRPRRGLRPTTPQHEAGTRMEPVPSPPEAAGTTPAATAAADPPLDPPGVTAADHGFTVGPNSNGSVVQWLPHSGVLVLPNTTRPASRYRSTVQADSVETWSRNARDPIASRVPASAAPRSLSRNGTPVRGPARPLRSTPDASSAAACARPLSNSSVITALRLRVASTRVIAASSSSTALISPAAASAACPTPSVWASSKADDESISHHSGDRWWCLSVH